jgi:undecaprenyl diphosphate synthase
MPVLSTTVNTPRHIAIIMDGNGRWAKQRNRARTAGHQAGLKATRSTVQNCVELGIESLTLFAFSSENWRRPDQEVGMLMDLFLRALKSEVEQLHENGVCVRFIGDLTSFSSKLQQQMSAVEQTTRDNTVMNLSIAVNYGGRWDIAQAARRVALSVQSGDLSVNEIDVESVDKYLALSDLPDPDLLIRTGGELRLSNYLLWQMAYTELYFTDLLWPDFDMQALRQAISWFSGCERRFGKTGEQIDQANHA